MAGNTLKKFAVTFKISKNMLENAAYSFVIKGQKIPEQNAYELEVIAGKIPY